MWLKISKCNDVVKTAWLGSDRRYMQSDIPIKLGGCMRALIRRSWNNLGNNQTYIRETNEKLRSITRGISNHEFETELSLKEKLWQLWKLEEIYCHQSSRLKWIRHVDRTQNYFIYQQSNDEGKIKSYLSEATTKNDLPMRRIYWRNWPSFIRHSTWLMDPIVPTPHFWTFQG